MDFWAEFNILFICHQIFSMIQYILMFFLSWNFEIYIYDFRIIRYMSLIAAVIYDTFYIIMSASALDLVFVKGKAEDAANVYDVTSALILGYTSLLFLPTFATNLMIFMKEMTMN